MTPVLVPYALRELHGDDVTALRQMIAHQERGWLGN
jgi:hypothetical protein